MPLQRDVRDALDEPAAADAARSHEAAMRQANARRGLEAMLAERVEGKKPTPITANRMALIEEGPGLRVYRAPSSHAPGAFYEVVWRQTKAGLFVYHRFGPGRPICIGYEQHKHCWHITEATRRGDER